MIFAFFLYLFISISFSNKKKKTLNEYYLIFRRCFLLCIVKLYVYIIVSIRISLFHSNKILFKKERQTKKETEKRKNDRRKQNRPTQQTSTRSYRRGKMNKKTDIEFVCTGECVRMCVFVCFFIFYKQNMTMRKRRKAPSTKKKRRRRRNENAKHFLFNRRMKEANLHDV